MTENLNPGVSSMIDTFLQNREDIDQWKTPKIGESEDWEDSSASGLLALTRSLPIDGFKETGNNQSKFFDLGGGWSIQRSVSHGPSGKIRGSQRTYLSGNGQNILLSVNSHTEHSSVFSWPPVFKAWRKK